MLEPPKDDSHVKPWKENPPYELKDPRPRDPQSNPLDCWELQWLLVLEGQEKAEASVHPAEATSRVDASATIVERVVLILNIVC